MRTETKGSLNEESLKMVQELIQVNVDSREGFQKVAEKTEDITVANLFHVLAKERDAQATELSEFVTANGESPDDSGTFSAAAHRTLIDVRAALGGDATVMLIEAEKGEDVIKEKYEEALKCEPGSAMSDVLHRQYAAVKAAHDRVRDLRDQYKDK